MARVLVVEDNETNRRLFVYLLSKYGHQAVEADDGQACLDLLKEDDDFDLVLCDIQMPRVNGYEVARRLKAEACWRHIPVVAVTALAMVGDREKVVAAGFDGYITKPIMAATFVSQLETFMKPEKRVARH